MALADLNRRGVVALAAALLSGSAGVRTAWAGPEAAVGQPLPRWSDGQLDIHHISTGRGNCAFLILPDGTTLLIDAGDLDGEGFQKRSPALKLAPRRPSAEIPPGRAIADYITAALPAGAPAVLDYAVITHFHDDHFGGWRPGLSRSRRGAYDLTGITEVAEYVPIRTLIDGGAPADDDPGVIDPAQRANLRNYRTFVATQAGLGLRHQDLRVGANDQIRLTHHPERYPGFQVRNIKANEWLWDGAEGAIRLFDPADAIYADGKRQENPRSLALKLSYGAFDYFSGGDMTGLSGPGIPAWFDVETPAAKVIGPVDAMTLDHHGNRDASNANFLAALRPRVVVEQAWVSDQPGGEVVQRLASKALWPGERDVFSTALLDETRLALGAIVDQTYRSRSGHVVIRVDRGGATYRVYVLDDRDAALRVNAVFGPFTAGA